MKNNYKGRDLFDNIHPLATRELAIFEHNAKIVDQGALLKKKVTRPSAALLTWPKRFECSAFWGMMKLLEIDGKNAPGEKPLDPSPAEDMAIAEEPKPPKLNPEEVKDVAKQKSFRLRESIVMQAMIGPAPAGIDAKDRGGLDALIFQAANRGAQRSLHSKEEPATEMTTSKPTRASVVKRDSMLSPGDMTAIAALSAQLSNASVSRAMPSDCPDPIYELHIATLKYEKETCRAKLNVAIAEVQLAHAEQEVSKAKMEFARTQAAMLEKALAAYEEAEDKMDALTQAKK